MQPDKIGMRLNQGVLFCVCRIALQLASTFRGNYMQRNLKFSWLHFSTNDLTPPRWFLCALLGIAIKTCPTPSFYLSQLHVITEFLLHSSPLALLRAYVLLFGDILDSNGKIGFFSSVDLIIWKESKQSLLSDKWILLNCPIVVGLILPHYHTNSLGIRKVKWSTLFNLLLFYRIPSLLLIDPWTSDLDWRVGTRYNSYLLIMKISAKQLELSHQRSKRWLQDRETIEPIGWAKVIANALYILFYYSTIPDNSKDHCHSHMVPPWFGFCQLVVVLTTIPC